MKEQEIGHQALTGAEEYDGGHSQFHSGHEDLHSDDHHHKHHHHHEKVEKPIPIPIHKQVCLK